MGWKYKKIKFECLEFQKSKYNLIKKEIIITDKRRVYTSKELDYTCIELFESDGIKDYFEIDPKIYKYNNDILKDSDIFILQFPKGNDISFSNGKIILLKDNQIIHNASTEKGSSGSPIIRRSDENYIIGLHFGGGRKKNKDKYLYNLSTNFLSILNDIKEQINEINCIYIADKDNNEINILHDYNEDISKWNKNIKKLSSLESIDLPLLNTNKFLNNEKINEFREFFQLKKEDYTDEYLLKILKENNFNYEQSFVSLFQ